MAAPDHERHNRAFWDADAEAYQDVHGDELAAAPAAWGVWRIPETEIGALGDVVGVDALEYGCGAAQWAGAVARAGARRVVALDQSVAQLARGRAAARAAGVALVAASGEAVPCAPASFDLVWCDHGAMSFCDPERALPEVARVLRPGGRLAFTAATPLHYLCWDPDTDRPGDRLRRGWWELGRIDEPAGTVDFVLTPDRWIDALGRHGFTVERLVPLRRPPGGTTTYTDFSDPAWAERWPAEELWVARRDGAPCD